MHSSLQAEFEASSSPGSFRLLTSLSPILLTASSQLQRLSVLPWDDDADFGLLRPLMSMVSMAPSLEYLAVEIPFNRGIGPLAESVPSLRNLKVHSLTSPHSCAWHVVQANGDVLLGCK
jgi:hypothetical protein